MHCSNCDSDQLHEDAVTGQLICSECGIATGIYHGITQSQDFTETRGLRVIGKLDDPTPTASQPVIAEDIVDLDATFAGQPDLMSTPAPDHLDGRSAFLTSTQRQTRTKQTRVQQLTGADCAASFLSSEGSGSDDEQSVFQPDKTASSAQDYRPWRLSEPFTLIFRHQAHQLASLLELTDTRRQRFLDTAWHLWLVYLSVTGELGEQAWAHASSGPIRATRTLMDLCDVKWIQRRGTAALLSYLSGPTHPGSRTANSSQSDRDSGSREHRLSHFMWAGWSTLYEPGEGRESTDPFLKPLLKAHRAAVAKHRSTGARRGRGRGQKRRASSGSGRRSGPVVETPERKQLSPDSEQPVAEELEFKVPKEQDNNNDGDGEEEQEDKDQDKLNLIQMVPDPATSERLLSEVFGDHGSVASKASVTDDTGSCTSKNKRVKLSREDVYRSHIIKKLLLVDPWKRVFWRGQIHGRSRCLLSHNLAILFFAYLTISPTHESVVNPITWPHSDESLLSVGQVALTSLVTLSDLYELCKERRLTFIKARECLPTGQFAIHDQYLSPLLHPKRPPTMQLLTRATNQMLHMLGCFQLPRLPFSWLVQRHVIALGLPDAIYKVARLLLKRLRLVLSHSADLPTGPLLICSVPWLRVLRVEVVAMALVVITLRLLFKFDGLTEYRLACIAKLLDQDPADCSQSPTHTPQSTRPFDWTSWAAYVVPRFSQSSFNQPEARAESVLRESDVLLRCNNVSGLDLARVQTAKEFLGSYEFKVGESIGWGESAMYARKHGQIESKSALTKPLRDLIADRREESVPASSSQPTARVPDSPTSQPADKPSNVQPESRLTRTQQDGLLSPFRHTHLDYLLDTVIATPDQLFASPFAASLSVPERNTLTTWWYRFHQRRSFYTPICGQGLWGGRPVDTSVSGRPMKHTRGIEEKLTLPTAVERLIRAHDRQLAELLELTAINDLAQQQSVDQTSSTPTPAPPTSQNSVHTPDSTNSVRSNPSGGIQWLVQLCAFACGACTIQHLLVEIEMLEHMLFPVDAKTVKSERFLQGDLALIASLDLR